MTESQRPAGGAERRQNPHLRELVEEMMASVRAAVRVDLWTPQERAKCEADMARIMAEVREEALSRGSSSRL